ncbi:hypothetical protein C8P66_10968 [Humitalea rosea]|uniref:2OG-Fe dioxygenase family protein n=1 Tax=Humitalea rosea TaxID=990373 RepID=A0A2W7ILI2_9PROT|nr:2OG-Fe dioxygenase family protein [Humitalea rosea]PZW46571.1 hypothetical protein C8P66_10968 [Humitalea rosea]
MSAAAEPASLPVPPALAGLDGAGFAHVRPETMQALLGADRPELDTFAASWDRLETDGFMADGGRYRRRRLANFSARSTGHVRNPHRPHFQASVHNSLNGGIDRWFAPVEDAVAASPVLRALLDLGRQAADAVVGARDWFVEMHQFRIEAVAGAPGYPTPEGVHQDGVDLVIIAMIARTNLVGGETLVVGLDGATLAQFTLDGMLDTAVLDDRRLRHGVTPVAPADPALPSCRDVLVLTWKRV